MAVLDPEEPGAVAPGFPGVSDAQLGSVAEDRVATAILLQGLGTVAVAFPLLDLGFDLHLRRIRTLRIHPVQVKGRSFLDPDGLFQVSVANLHADPSGFVVLPYLPPPEWQLHEYLWAIPIPEFLRLAQRDGDGYIFSGYLNPAVRSAANQFLVEVSRFDRQWFARIPGWTDPVPRPQLQVSSSIEQVAKAQTRALGKSGELWLASQLMRTGLNDVVIAQDRLRVDCVDMVLHDVNSFAVAGLAVHTSSILADGHVQYRIRDATFFINDRLFVVLLVASEDGSWHDTAFLIASADIPNITTASRDRGDAGYQGRFRIDPLAPKMRPYAVPTKELGAAILRCAFGPR